MTLRWCPEHWTALRESIQDAGMGHLISQGGAAAAKRIKDELTGDATDATFDPLLTAWSMIDGAFAGPLPPGQMLHYMAEGAGNVCTLCELARLNPEKTEIVQNWIGGCTRQVRQMCVDKGLLPKGL